MNCSWILKMAWILEELLWIITTDRGCYHLYHFLNDWLPPPVIYNTSSIPSRSLVSFLSFSTSFWRVSSALFSSGFLSSAQELKLENIGLEGATRMEWGARILENGNIHIRAMSRESRNIEMEASFGFWWVLGSRVCTNISTSRRRDTIDLRILAKR